jgi:3-deoxy-D-manno-octulosonic-acid transferase
MENFEPLVSRLLEKHAAIRVTNANELCTALRSLLADRNRQQQMTLAAIRVLELHAGAAERTIKMLGISQLPQL